MIGKYRTTFNGGYIVICNRRVLRRVISPKTSQMATCTQFARSFGTNYNINNGVEGGGKFWSTTNKSVIRNLNVADSRPAKNPIPETLMEFSER